MKLQVKVPILVIAILLIIGGISSGIMIYYLRKATTDQFYETAETVTQAVRGCLELCMLSGDEHHVQHEITTIAQKDQVNGIVLALPDGSICASSDSSQVGKVMDTDWVQPVLQSADYMTFSRNEQSQHEFLTVTPVMNDSQCQPCHTRDSGILGLIVVDLNTLRMDEQLKDETVLIAAFGGFTFLFTGAGLAFVLRRTTLKPLSLLSGSAQRIARGEYSERVKNYKDDEIGMLAQSFNEMAENVEQRKRDLEKSHNELSALNIGLEEKISQRTREISALNAVLTIINQSSDEEKLIKNTLASILNETGLEAGMIHMVDKKSSQLVCVSQQGLSERSAAELMKVEIGEYIQGQAFQSKEVIVGDCNYIQQTETITGERGELPSCICLPIKSDGSVLGTLSLAKPEFATEDKGSELQK